MTAGRRSSPVPQLTCVGGTAGCRVGQPKVVQCYNRGWDGYDVQWECKAQTDKKYQLGRIQVSCEGYDYPDDPYILRGSCGLEYELDLTEQGHHGSDNHHYDNRHYDYSHSRGSSGIGSLIGLAIMILLIYACFKMCQSAQRANSSSYGYTGTPDSAGAYPSTGMGGTGRPGFWTGAGMGGLLGYMFGRGNGGGGGYYRRPPHYGWNVGGGGSGWGSSPRSSWSSGGSHTTSGFGGTRRR